MASLSSLGLSPRVVTKLTEADFLLSSDVCSLKPTELSAATQLSLKESTEVIRLASSKPSSILSQANNLKTLVEEEEIEHIVTFCQSIDELFGGGIPLKAITEISGTPGIGKTQMCLQACVSVQLPKGAGGVEGEAVFIDTEGSFSVLRLKEMAEFAESHVKQFHCNDNISEFNTENILKRVYYFRCHSYLELIAVIKHLPRFLAEHGNVRLVVIDSIAFHFRHDFTDMKARTSLLCSITQDLIQQASKNRLAVIITNQMTTKIESSGGSQVVAALGESWGHCPTIRLFLFWSGNTRVAKIIKAPHMPKSTVYFQITSGGVRDHRRETTMDGSDRRKRKLSGD